MARFRFLGLHDPDENGNTGCQEAASGYICVGFGGLRLVHPGDIFEVNDNKPVVGKDDKGEPVYGDSDADAYRVCEARYEELPDSGGATPSFAPPPEPEIVTAPEPEDES